MHLETVRCCHRFVIQALQHHELRHALVSFARGVHQEEFCTAYALLGDRANMHFDIYLQHVLQPGFWVGTVFYIWTSLAYGYNI